MEKWADFLISKVSYDENHKIQNALRHEETPKGITPGSPVDRITIASDLRHGRTYSTIYSSNDSWRKGQNLRVYSLGGNPYIRIDGNNVDIDFLGDIPE